MLHEAVGTAKWTGTPLKPLLESAGLAANAHDVVFFGRDRGFDCGIENDYGCSLSPEQTLRDDKLPSWAMNGAELPPQHGFPLRLVVPGWYGMDNQSSSASIAAGSATMPCTASESQ
jgi:DMSO/TMAO reductase YedYZ molybdopterin-dependent catalytic subunit